MDGGDCAPVSLDHMALSALPTCKYPPTSTPVGGQERRAPLLRPSPVEPPHQERVRSRNREWDLRRAAVGAAAVQEAPLGLRVAQVLANEQAEPDAEAGLKRDHLLFLCPLFGDTRLGCRSGGEFPGCQHESYVCECCHTHCSGRRRVRTHGYQMPSRGQHLLREGKKYGGKRLYEFLLTLVRCLELS